MRRMILMRHAEAAAENGAADHARPLTARGRSDALRAGQAIAEVGGPDFALLSDSRRTRDTFDLVQERLGVVVPHRLSRDLYGATPRQILDATRDVPPTVGRLLIIGHNPGIGELVSQSSRDDGDAALVAEAARFPTASFAVLAADAPFADFGRGGRLEWLFMPEAGLLPPRS